MTAYRWLLPLVCLLASRAAAQATSIRPLVPNRRAKSNNFPVPRPRFRRPRAACEIRAELAAFLDGVMAANLRDKHVAGATVAVVKDGALLFAKGYGYSDVAHRTPVDAERSLFRIGSTSKLFTWTAVMQLVEQGKLDLDTDVNRYLDFKIPATYPQPITLRHIMTHTPGFEEDGRDLITDDSTRMHPARPLARDAHSRTRAAAGHILVVLELRDRARRLHRAAHVRRAVRRLHRAAHSHAARHDADDDASAAAGAACAADMSDGYTWGGGIVRAAQVRDRRTDAGGLGRLERDRHGEVHARALEQRRVQRPAHSRRVDRACACTRARSATIRGFPGSRSASTRSRATALRIIGHGGDTQWFHTDLALVPGREARRVRLVQHEHGR